MIVVVEPGRLKIGAFPRLNTPHKPHKQMLRIGLQEKKFTVNHSIHNSLKETATQVGLIPSLPVCKPQLQPPSRNFLHKDGMRLCSDIAFNGVWMPDVRTGDTFQGLINHDF